MSLGESRRLLGRTAFALLCLISAAATALAQEVARPATEKWRPKDGIYADPKSPDNQCGDFGELSVALANKEIRGDEWSCRINRLTDTAPGAIRLDLTCNDYNLAESINDPNPERQFKETMLLRKMDGKSIFVRKTLNGKFKGPEWRTTYCPEDAQRHYVEVMAKDKADAAEKERSKSSPWRPRDGVYAMPGKDFDDRCLKSGDAIIGLAERSISSGADKCSVTFIRDEPDFIRLFVICSAEPSPQESTGRTGDGSNPVSRSSETIILKKNVDETVLLQKTRNGAYVDSGKQLSYCSEVAQRR